MQFVMIRSLINNRSQWPHLLLQCEVCESLNDITNYNILASSLSTN